MQKQLTHKICQINYFQKLLWTKFIRLSITGYPSYWFVFEFAFKFVHWSVKNYFKNVPLTQWQLFEFEKIILRVSSFLLRAFFEDLSIVLMKLIINNFFKIKKLYYFQKNYFALCNNCLLPSLSSLLPCNCSSITTH